MARGDSLLAVCIPTYKRPDLLERSIRSVIRAGRDFETPIVVTDDSTDETNVPVIRRMQSEYPHIHHHRNDRNLGIDGNIVESMNQCPARYGWWLGEDDLLTPTAIRQVRQILEGADPPEFLFVNYSAVNEDYTRILKRRAIPLIRDATMEASAFLARYGWAAGFIGACVINRLAWGRIDVTPYIGTWFAHVGGIFSAVVGRAVGIVAEPLVWNRTGSAGVFTWTGSMLDVLDGWRRLMSMLEPLYGAEVCAQSARAFERAHGLNSILFLAYARAGGALTPELVREAILPGDYSPLYKLAARCLARTPVSWCRMAQRTWHALISERADLP